MNIEVTPSMGVWHGAVMEEANGEDGITSTPTPFLWSDCFKAKKPPALRPRLHVQPEPPRNVSDTDENPPLPLPRSTVAAAADAPSTPAVDPASLLPSPPLSPPLTAPFTPPLVRSTFLRTGGDFDGQLAVSTLLEEEPEPRPWAPRSTRPFPFMQRGTLELSEALVHRLKMVDSGGQMAPMVEIPDEKDQRFCVLSYEQVRRLNDLMSDVLSIHGRGNFPTIEVKLRDLVSVVRRRLEEDHGVKVKEVRLNGSGASSVLAADFREGDGEDGGCSPSDISYNDLDLIFSVDLSTGRAYDRVKCAVLESLMQLLPEGVSRKRMSSCSMKEAYVSKMVKVNDNSDRWSLITLGNNRSKSVELKFVHTMRRQYEFSVDSFHVLLDTLFLFYDCADAVTPIGDNFYPTVVGESMYGDFHESLYHLHKRLIATRNPEEIRGGGLLKYCNLLCKGYRPAWPEEVKNMERYMCSRFFIDFPDIRQQQAKLENYLYNHFQGTEDRLKYEYLMILHHVVDESTVCLMGHERRLTLALIEDLAFQVYTPPEGAYEYATSSSSSAASSGSSSSAASTVSSAASTASEAADPNLLSPMSMSDACSTISSSSSSTSSSGYTTPQKAETPSPLQQQQQPLQQVPPPPVATASATTATTVQQKHSSGVTSTATVITTTGHHASPPVVGHAPTTSLPPPPPHPPVAVTPPSMIPTYEIVTSCQPAVVYSNGYYYTSFASQHQQHQQQQQQQHGGNSNTAAVQSLSGPCLACSCPTQQQQQPTQQHPPQQHHHQHSTPPPTVPHHHQQQHHQNWPVITAVANGNHHYNNNNHHHHHSNNNKRRGNRQRHHQQQHHHQPHHHHVNEHVSSTS